MTPSREASNEASWTSYNWPTYDPALETETPPQELPPATLADRLGQMASLPQNLLGSIHREEVLAVTYIGCLLAFSLYITGRVRRRNILQIGRHPRVPVFNEDAHPIHDWVINPPPDDFWRGRFVGGEPQLDGTQTPPSDEVPSDDTYAVGDVDALVHDPTLPTSEAAQHVAEFINSRQLASAAVPPNLAVAIAPTPRTHTNPTPPSISAAQSDAEEPHRDDRKGKRVNREGSNDRPVDASDTEEAEGAEHVADTAQDDQPILDVDIPTGALLDEFEDWEQEEWQQALLENFAANQREGVRDGAWVDSDGQPIAGPSRI
ncbi:hypothetical protein FOMPIDRAFT_82133 [Fomitopsis schrenkii]|uniref:Uncharacterized protein n=1 Tax=Fomitopsis schrenkii TaxID=2126942 RepID=S8G2Q2_FOMSC|nr:hypothetical protein FOMPIDRAFT_82133 [Fomitopsis schrenkii]